jgi:hypothetical protein
MNTSSFRKLLCDCTSGFQENQQEFVGFCRGAVTKKYIEMDQEVRRKNIKTIGGGT